MKIVIAIDSFKGSLSSMGAGNAAADGIRRVYPDADIVIRPLADGGEGTVDALVSGMNGTIHTTVVCDSLGRSIDCQYGIAGHTAIIEMSSAAGLTLLDRSERNPLYTTTYGVGEIIKDAISKGCREFIIGIGGSTTIDGCVGMLQALGFDMLDCNGKQVDFGAKGLSKLCSISDDNVIAELDKCRFYIACDVNNPLYGENGCSAVYAPQKGATPDMTKDMDTWLNRYAELTHNKYPHANPYAPGAGAAGGIGFAFLSYMNASLVPGVELILDKTNLEECIKDADFVITGEGQIDSQTAMGKAPSGVAVLAKKYGAPIIAFAGSVAKNAVKCHECGIDAIFPIVRGVCTLDEAMNIDNAKANLADTAEQVFRLIRTIIVSKFRQE